MGEEGGRGPLGEHREGFGGRDGEGVGEVEEGEDQIQWVAGEVGQGGAEVVSEHAHGGMSGDPGEPCGQGSEREPFGTRPAAAPFRDGDQQRAPEVCVLALSVAMRPTGCPGPAHGVQRHAFGRGDRCEPGVVEGAVGGAFDGQCGCGGEELGQSGPPDAGGDRGPGIVDGGRRLRGRDVVHPVPVVVADVLPRAGFRADADDLLGGLEGAAGVRGEGERGHELPWEHRTGQGDPLHDVVGFGLGQDELGGVGDGEQGAYVGEEGGQPVGPGHGERGQSGAIEVLPRSQFG